MAGTHLAFRHESEQAPDLEEFVQQLAAIGREKEVPHGPLRELVPLSPGPEHPHEENENLDASVADLGVVKMQHALRPYDLDDSSRGDLRKDVLVRCVRQDVKDLRAHEVPDLDRFNPDACGHLAPVEAVEEALPHEFTDADQGLQRRPLAGGAGEAPPQLRSKALVHVLVPTRLGVVARGPGEGPRRAPAELLRAHDVARAGDLGRAEHRLARQWVVVLVLDLRHDGEGLQVVFARLRRDAHQLPPALANVDVDPGRRLDGQGLPPRRVHAGLVGDRVPRLVAHELRGGRRGLPGDLQDVVDAATAENVQLPDREVPIVQREVQCVPAVRILRV
mmetsp:Transcript_85154/g.260210  ORF Transcript_85154/g.260210 Transcript_85154/m.260210 type:complete len:335 (-) Transcript_85154:1647-2651(-)